MAMQEDPEWRRVLLLLTAIVLLIAMAATGTMFLRLMGTDTDAELDIIVWIGLLLILLFSLSPYVFLFLCRSWMVTDLQASVLLWGSVAISGSGVVMLLCTAMQSNDALSGVWFFIIPHYQWIACVILLVCIKIFARPK